MLERTLEPSSYMMQPTPGTLVRGKPPDPPGWPCPIARSADLLGDPWNLPLIRQACLGARRFDDFQAALGIGRNILTQRLNRLVDEGVLRRVEDQQNPSPPEDRPTPKSRGVYPHPAAPGAGGGRLLPRPGGGPPGPPPPPR